MIRRRSVLAALLALPAACASPNPNFYTLAAVPGEIVHGRARIVELRRIGLAGYLDQPQIVRTAAEYRLRMADTDRWGEALGRMFGRVLTENLVQRLPDASVFTESGAISTQPDTVVEIDVQRFDADASNTVTLLAQVAVRHDGTKIPAVARTIRLTSTLSGAGTSEYVGALSAILGQLADIVARMIEA